MEELRHLHYKGLTGIIAFWMTMIMMILPLCTVCYSIYWMVLVGNKLWLNAVGGDLFVSNFFTMLFAFSSFAFLIIYVFDPSNKFVHLAYQLFIITTIVALILSAVSLSLSTFTSADRAYQAIIDYCIRLPAKSEVTKFLDEYSTFYSRKQYILNKTVNANSSFAGLFGSWLASFIVYFTVFHLLNERESANNQSK